MTSNLPASPSEWLCTEQWLTAVHRPSCTPVDTASHSEQPLDAVELQRGKTGKQYSFVVGYFPWDDGDVVVSSTANWPKVVGTAQDVRVLIKGQWFTPHPTAIKEAEQKADVLSEFARRNGPRAAKGLMLGLPGDRQPDRQRLLAAAAKTTLVQFSLTAAT